MENRESAETHNYKDSLPADYWNRKWLKLETDWDIGYASPAVVDFFRKVSDKNARILIPGCGNAYEAENLLEQGFTDISVIDISTKACTILAKKFETNKNVKIYCGDFFQHNGEYDYILEQTFFCAIPAEERNSYAKKTSQLLAENGLIIGLLFDTEFAKQRPPFGGSSKDYSLIFEPYFNILKMETSVKSIPERDGKELFIKLKKKYNS